MTLTLPDLFAWLHQLLTWGMWNWASIILDTIINHFMKGHNYYV